MYIPGVGTVPTLTTNDTRTGCHATQRRDGREIQTDDKSGDISPVRDSSHVQRLVIWLAQTRHFRYLAWLLTSSEAPGTSASWRIPRVAHSLTSPTAATTILMESLRARPWHVLDATPCTVLEHRERSVASSRATCLVPCRAHPADRVWLHTQVRQDDRSLVQRRHG